MKKLKMARGVTLTFEEGCNRYLENCRQSNLTTHRLSMTVAVAVAIEEASK